MVMMSSLLLPKLKELPKITPFTLEIPFKINTSQGIFQNWLIEYPFHLLPVECIFHDPVILCALYLQYGKIRL